MKVYICYTAYEYESPDIEEVFDSEVRAERWKTEREKEIASIHQYAGFDEWEVR